MTRDQIVSLFFIALLVFVVYEVAKIFSIFYRAIFWGGVLAFAFYPLYLGLTKRLRMSPVIASLVMTVTIFLVVVPPVLWIGAGLAAQAIELYQSVVASVRAGRLDAFIEKIHALSFVQQIEDRYFNWEPFKQSVIEWVIASARAIGNFGAAQAGQLTKGVLFMVLNLFLTFILVFVFLLDGEKIYRFVYRIAPLEEANKKFIFGQINECMAAVIRGQLLTSLVQGTAAGFVFWFLQLPIPIFFGAATFLATMIPVVGASFVWVPFVLYLFLSGSYVKAVSLLVLGILFISLLDNILKPALIGERTKLPYFLLFFGVMGGIKLYGLMGIFVAPVVLSLFFALTRIYQQKYLSSEG